MTHSPRQLADLLEDYLHQIERGPFYCRIHNVVMPDLLLEVIRMLREDSPPTETE